MMDEMRGTLMRDVRKRDTGSRCAKKLLLCLLAAMAAAVATLAAPVRAEAVTYNMRASTGANLGGFTTNYGTCGTNNTTGNVIVPMNSTSGANQCTTGRAGSTGAPGTLLLMVIAEQPYAQDMTVTGVDVTGNIRDYQEAANPGTLVGLSYELGYASGGVFTSFGSVNEVRDYSTQANWTTNLSTVSGTAPAGSYLAIRAVKQNANVTQYRYYFTATSLVLNVTETIACTDPDPATLTTTNPLSTSTVSGTVTVQAQVGTETVPSGLTGMVLNIAGAGACNVTNGAMAWNAGTSRWEYSWNTSACGTVTPVTGVTVDISGTDPDCSTAVNAPQITNVTINNVCTDPSPSTITVTSGQTYSGDNFNVSGGFSSTGNVGTFEYQVETNTGTLCRAWSATAAIPSTTASGSLCGNFTNGGTYRLYVRGTDPDCGGQTINAAPVYENFTWSACTDPDVSTITINPPAGGSTVKGVYTITATVTGETVAPNDYTSMSVTTAGTTAGVCDVTGAAMTDQGGGVWTYAWDTSACGTVAPETGITINASGTDADCSTLRNAAQVTNITVDNTCDMSIDLSCTECHGAPPADGARNWATGATPGSHQLHGGAGITACATCHADNGTNQNHRNKNIDMAAAINTPGGSYTKGASFAQVSNPTLGSCANTNCHGAGSPTWGTNTTNDGCTKCHGTPTASPAADMYKAPPSDLAGNTLNTDPEVGAHRAHLNSPTATTHAISGTIVCTECHKVPASASDPGHFDTGNPAEITFGTLANNSGALAPSYVEATGVCNNTYCHGKTLSDGDKPRAWNAPGLNGTKTNDCAYCHGYPPASITDHTGLNVNTAGECAACHDHVSTNNDGFTDYTKHINGNIEGGSCVACHATERGSPTLYRRDVTGTAGDIEPGLVSHHIKNTTAIDGASCQVCHDQSSHKGNADPGVKIFNADTAASISYTGTASELVPHCLSCHDSAGAVNNTTTPFSASGDLNKPFDVKGGHGSNASGVTQSCVQTSCHGNFGAAGTTLDPKANAHGSTVAKIRDSAATKVYDGRAPAAADSATFICMSCHTTYYNGGAWTGTAFTDHNTHVSSYSVPCKACHYNTPHGAAYVNFDTADVSSGRRAAKLTPPTGRGGMLLADGGYTPAPYGATNSEVGTWNGGGMGSQSMRLYVRSWPSGAWTIGATGNCGYTNAFPPTGVTVHN